MLKYGPRLWLPPCGLLFIGAVVIMVLSREPAKSVHDPLDGGDPARGDPADENDDNESIGSFVASELAVSSPHEDHDTQDLRYRPPGANQSIRKHRVCLN